MKKIVVTIFANCFFGLALLLFVSQSVFAQDFSFKSPGNPTGYVNDFASILTPETKQTLENELSEFQKTTSNEISVVTIQTLGNDTIENYANTLFRAWGIGTKTNNNGVLLLISKDERQMRIEVGYGLEGALPDITASSIIRNDITPAFKAGNYDEGVTKGVASIISATKGEYVANTTETKNFPDIMPFIFFLLFFGANIFISVMAPSKSWWLGGVVGGIVGFIAGYIFFSLIGLVVGGALLAIIGLLVDRSVSRAYQKKGITRSDTWGSNGFWWGGGSGGFGSGGGGFGGFSGGSSGGGGSSGSW